jgi:Xaa-Pro aminopeptidase
VQYDVLDNAVWNLLVEKLTSPNLLQETFRRYEQERSERNNRTQQKIAILRELLEKKEHIRANLLRTLSEQEDDETRALLSRDLRRLAEEMKDTRRELEIAEKLQKAGSETEQALKNFLTWCADTAEELKVASLEDKRQILYGLGVEVTLYKRDHNPHFTLAIRGPASQRAPLVFAGTALNAKTPLVNSVL